MPFYYIKQLTFNTSIIIVSELLYTFFFKKGVVKLTTPYLISISYHFFLNPFVLTKIPLPIAIKLISKEP